MTENGIRINRVVLSEDLSSGHDYGGVRVENPFVTRN